jgi:hypothetical protein
METFNSIPADDYCSHYRIETSFIQTLEQHGLITITTVNEKLYLEPEQLPQIEKYRHLHYDLDINMEGIEAISHLLNRINNMHREMTELRNKLLGYGSE